MSEKANINEKLFKLQQEIGTISKDAKNPFYKSKYFDINSLIKQLQPLLKKNRLLLLQPIEEDMVMSKLICVDGSGGVVSGLKLPEINDPQKLGSAITYYRRYTLASLLGLQSVDDDANLTIGSSKSPANDLPWLNRGTTNFSKVVKALKSGDFKIEDVLKKYRLSVEIKEELSGL